MDTFEMKEEVRIYIQYQYRVLMIFTSIIKRTQGHGNMYSIVQYIFQMKQYL
jgi:hypothetical protein